MLDALAYAPACLGEEADNEITQELKAMDVTTFTPIEALNKLYELTKPRKRDVKATRFTGLRGETDGKN